MEQNQETSFDIDKCVEWIKSADCILIGAGAGLSVECGIDYSDEESFKKKYHALHKKKGLTNKWQTIGYKNWTETERWAFVAMNMNDFFTVPLHPVYERLLDIAKTKDYFVITTNVDNLFRRHKFDPERIYTPQGSYSYVQCLKPCTQETWPAEPIVEKLLPLIDPVTQEIKDPKDVPVCPNCGGKTFANVRGGDWFLEGRYEEGKRKYREWVQKNAQKKIVMLEFGVGFNTPVWIRFPFEQLTYVNKNARLIRVNVEYPQVPEEIESSSQCIPATANDTVTQIWKKLFNKE